MPVYTLKSPKVLDGKPVVKIDFNELELDQVIDLAELDTSDLRVMKAWLAKALQVDERLIGKLSMRDFQGLVEAATGPLPEAPGETPSPSPPN